MANVLDTIIEELKIDEGFEGNEYLDHLGFPTIGYGTKLPLTEEEGELLARHRLTKMIKELIHHKPIVPLLPEDAQIILCNMAYQMGVPNLLEFKNMWQALENGNYKKAADEMRDSLWNRQTPTRSRKLASIMEAIHYG